MIAAFQRNAFQFGAFQLTWDMSPQQTEAWAAQLSAGSVWTAAVKQEEAWN